MLPASSPEPEEPSVPVAEHASTQTPPPDPSYYECFNDCVSSLGVAQLVAGVATGLGCTAGGVACPIVVGAAAGAISGWCDAECDEPNGDGNP